MNKIQATLAVATAATLAAAMPALAEGSLNIYNWGNYTSPELIEKFEAEYDVDVTLDGYDSNETMLAKVKEGGTGYDIVVPGVTLNDLKNGTGHYPDTPLPGQLGNAAVAGHRTTYGAPFFDVDQLETGDEIITTLLNGDRFVYEVTFSEVVSATDYWVVTTRDPNIAELTLT